MKHYYWWGDIIDPLGDRRWSAFSPPLKKVIEHGWPAWYFRLMEDSQ
jgi:hypothetical protein